MYATMFFALLRLSVSVHGLTVGPTSAPSYVSPADIDGLGLRLLLQKPEGSSGTSDVASPSTSRRPLLQETHAKRGRTTVAAPSAARGRTVGLSGDPEPPRRPHHDPAKGAGNEIVSAISSTSIEESASSTEESASSTEGKVVTVIFIRHAQTYANTRKNVMAALDAKDLLLWGFDAMHTDENWDVAHLIWDSPLSDVGRAQADNLGNALGTFLNGKNVALCAVSPLVRTHQTAAAALGFTTAGPALEVPKVEVWSSLNERSDADRRDGNMMRPHPTNAHAIPTAGWRHPKQLAVCGHTEWVYCTEKHGADPPEKRFSNHLQTGWPVWNSKVENISHVHGLFRFQEKIALENRIIEKFDTNYSNSINDDWTTHRTKRQLEDTRNVGDLYSSGMTVPVTAVGGVPNLLVSSIESVSRRMLADILSAVADIKHPSTEDVLILSSHSEANRHFFKHIFGKKLGVKNGGDHAGDVLSATVEFDDQTATNLKKLAEHKMKNASAVRMKFHVSETSGEDDLPTLQKISEVAYIFNGYDDNGELISTPAVNAHSLGRHDLHVRTISASDSSFAAIRFDGSVVTWRSYGWHADTSWVPPPREDLAGGVESISATSGAFAAIKSDGSVVTWGDRVTGGDSSAVGWRRAEAVGWRRSKHQRNALCVRRSQVGWQCGHVGAASCVWSRGMSAWGSRSDGGVGGWRAKHQGRAKHQRNEDGVRRYQVGWQCGHVGKTWTSRPRGRGRLFGSMGAAAWRCAKHQRSALRVRCDQVRWQRGHMGEADVGGRLVRGAARAG